MADAREWRALGRMIECEAIARGNKTLYKELHGIKNKEWLFHLGFALHPIQDLTGHNDDYVTYDRFGTAGASFLPVGNNVWHHFNNRLYDPTKYADDVDSYFEKHGITYYHWDDVIWTRDLTYDLIGRFYKEYKNLL